MGNIKKKKEGGTQAITCISLSKISIRVVRIFPLHLPLNFFSFPHPKITIITITRGREVYNQQINVARCNVFAWKRKGK